VTVHEVLADAAGELFAQVVRGDAFEAVDQRGDREFRRVADEQVDVAGFAVRNIASRGAADWAVSHAADDAA
jgi:hypothetical protein